MASTDAVKPEIQVFVDRDALMRAAADEVATCADAAIRSRGRFLIALSGGSTPARLYALLATESYAPRIDWARVHIWWGDERCVPPDDPASNYRMTRAALLDHVPIPAAHIHRMRGEDDPVQAAAAYTAELRGFCSEREPVPRFDLVLLGLGADGHTASLFPGTAAVTEDQRWVVAHYVPVQSAWRITLTPIVINAAAEILFLVTGADKSGALHRVLDGPSQPALLPAQAIAPQAGRVRWFVDAAAAAKL